MLGILRKIVQISVFAFMFLVPVLNVLEIFTVTGTFYAVKIGGLGVADPVVILQSVFATGEATALLLTAALFPILVAILFGRIWCGWMCPYHLISDVSAWVRSRVKKSVLVNEQPQSTAFQPNVSRYAFLTLGTALSGALGIPILNYLHAPGIISTEAMILVKERAFSIEIAFIVMLILLEITILPRFWCRYFCPTGAVLSLFRTKWTLHPESSVQKTKGGCCTKQYCVQVCPMKLVPYQEGVDHLCTNCGLCIDACKSGHMRFKGFSI